MAATWTGTTPATWQGFGTWAGVELRGTVTPGTRLAPEARKGDRGTPADIASWDDGPTWFDITTFWSATRPASAKKGTR